MHDLDNAHKHPLIKWLYKYRLILLVFLNILTTAYLVYLVFNPRTDIILKDNLWDSLYVVVLLPSILIIGVFLYLVLSMVIGRQIYYLFSSTFLFCLTVPIGFAHLYSLVQAQGPCIANADKVGDIFDFSYTTLTTVGYGELYPLSYCRVLTSIESTVGYVFLGIISASTFSGLGAIKVRIDRYCQRIEPHSAHDATGK